jgi:site-specific DNA recombinase
VSVNSPVALYARVSTGRQERERTIESQLDAMRGLLHERGLAPPEPLVYRDDGYSGARLDRPGLDGLRDAAADGKIGMLAIYDPDRLARNFVHQQVLLEEFERRGVEVVFVQRPLSDHPEDRLLTQMQGVFAEYERTKISERTRRGRLFKARLGMYLNWVVPPYGYRSVANSKGGSPTPAIDEAEAQWVRKMFQWVVEEGLSSRQVARRLNQLGAEPRKSACWTHTVVGRLLGNPVYGGTACYNRTEGVEPRRRRTPDAYPREVKSSRRYRPREEWILIPVPAIVSPELQARALEEIHRHRWDLPRSTRYPYLLRGRVVCGVCGRRMGAMSGQAPRGPHPRGGRSWYPYYQCPANHKAPEDTGRLQKCLSRRIRADRLDEAVWSSLATFLQRPEVLRVEIAAYLDDRRSSSKGEETERHRLEERARQLGRQRARLVDAYQAGLLELKELRGRGERLETELGEVQRRQGELEGLRLRRARAEEVFQEVEAFCRKLREGLERLTFDERRQVIRWILERVVVKDGAVTVEHIIPLTGRFRPPTGSSAEGDQSPVAVLSEPATSAEAVPREGSHGAFAQFSGMWTDRQGRLPPLEEARP